MSSKSKSGGIALQGKSLIAAVEDLHARHGMTTLEAVTAVADGERVAARYLDAPDIVEAANWWLDARIQFAIWTNASVEGRARLEMFASLGIYATRDCPNLIGAEYLTSPEVNEDAATANSDALAAQPVGGPVFVTPSTVPADGLAVTGADTPQWLLGLAESFEDINSMPLREAALWYAQHDIPVFPLRPGTKFPYANPDGVADGHGGFKLATTDLAQVTAWWEQYPTSNIGIPTGNRYGGVFDCLDCDYDTEKGKDGIASAVILQKTGLLAGVSIVASTPRGGRHLVFAPSDAHTIATGEKAYGFAIDLRGSGGFIAASPSVNKDGMPYQWVKVAPANFGPTIDWTAIVKRLRTTPEPEPQVFSNVTSNGTSNIEGLRRWLRSREEGGRNAAIYSTAIALLKEGHDPNVLMEDAAVLFANEADELVRAAATIRSAMRGFAAMGME